MQTETKQVVESTKKRGSNVDITGILEGGFAKLIICIVLSSEVFTKELLWYSLSKKLTIRSVTGRYRQEFVITLIGDQLSMPRTMVHRKIVTLGDLVQINADCEVKR